MKEELLSKRKWVVLGASSNTKKFGYKIVKHMVAAGYEVYPVNPNVASIDDIPCYPSLKDLPCRVDVVDFVVPEAIGLAALEECKELGISYVWLQPGADKPSILEKAKSLGIHAHQGCVLIDVK